MTKRAPSPLTYLKKLAAQGIHARATLPDGTVIEVVPEGAALTTLTPQNNDPRQKEIDDWDKAFGAAH
jgi:hypothetical protein